MRLEIRTENKQFTVSRAPEPRTDQSDRQRTEKDTGAPQWQLQLVAMDETGAEVIRVTVAGNPPEVLPGQPVQVERLVAFPGSRTAAPVSPTAPTPSTRSRPGPPRSGSRR